jgi:hypothetical protein
MNQKYKLVMKPITIKRNLYLSVAVLAMVTLIIACGKKFLEQKTVGLLTEAEAQSKKGAQQFLIGSYAASEVLDGKVEV